ncbi:MAG: aldehyde dehydrogenase family protein, partial [Pseudomonadota bacterium]
MDGHSPLTLPFDSRQMLIGDVWRDTAETLAVVDPSTGAEIAQIGRGTRADIADAVAAARAAQNGAWGRMPAAERGRLLLDLGRLIETRIEELAHLEALDVG